MLPDKLRSVRVSVSRSSLCKCTWSRRTPVINDRRSVSCVRFSANSENCLAWLASRERYGSLLMYSPPPEPDSGTVSVRVLPKSCLRTKRIVL
ncbi:hypothetical protein D3C75_1197370 [compost metagenome]